MTPLVLVDGHNLLWRAAFGFPARIKSRDGEDRTAVFGFFALARVASKLVSDPAEWVVCFDGEFGARDRASEDGSYKQRRAPADNGHLASLPHIKAGLDFLSIRWIELDEREADDVIATLASRETDRHVYIMSTDRDFYQLVSDRIRVLNTAMRDGQRIIGIEEICRRYHVTPGQWCDFRALTGDPADNISGVPGVGPQTAARLLADGLALENLEGRGRLTGRHGTRLTSCWDKLLRDRWLVRLRHIAEVPQLTRGTPSSAWATPARMLEELGLW